MDLATALILLRSDQLSIGRFMQLAEENKWDLKGLNLK